MTDITAIKNMVKDETKKHGGLVKSIASARKMTEDLQIISCDPCVSEEIKEIMRGLGWNLDQQKPTDPMGMRLLGMPPMSLAFTREQVEPEITPIPLEYGDSEEKHLVVVINKENKKALEEALEAAGWIMGKELSYPVVGGVQSWTKTV